MFRSDAVRDHPAQRSGPRRNRHRRLHQSEGPVPRRRRHLAVDVLPAALRECSDLTPCETIPLNVPAHAEIVIEGYINLKDRFRVGDVTSPSMYYLPHYENVPI